MPINSFLYPGAKVTLPYEVDNSCRFNAADSPYFARATSASGNQRKFTISVWLKMDIHASGASHFIFDTGDSADYFKVYFTTEPYLKIVGRISNSNVLELIPSKGFRDPTAWFHLYIAVDTTQGTASNRVKVYINGVQETSFGTATYPNQNTDFVVNDTGEPIEVGINSGHSSGESYDGYMAEYVFVDGAAQAISDFGEFDEDSPTIWIPKDVSGIAVNPDGANGFYLDFKDSSNLGNDAAGGTDFSENNIVAADQATDTPTNNFATLNPLWRSNFANDGVYSEGNCKLTFTSANSDKGYGVSTMGVTSGKWYWEIKLPTIYRAGTGVADANRLAGFSATFWDSDPSYGINFNNNGNVNENNTATSSWASALSDNDIVMFALDMDNHRLWYGINGTWQDSGDPTSGATGTGDFTTQISDQSHLNTGEFIFPLVIDGSTTGKASFEMNFGGCPAFSISSGNADGNGYGNFEYSVPANFYSICTKNLAEYGG